MTDPIVAYTHRLMGKTMLYAGIRGAARSIPRRAPGFRRTVVALPTRTRGDRMSTQAEERVRKLHRRGESDFIVGDCAINECDHEYECPTMKRHICLHCWSIAEQANPYFAEQDCPVDVIWPCPTIKAIA